MTESTDGNKIKQRCICCNSNCQANLMKFIVRTGHWICRECFSSVESGFPMVQAQLGYEWRKVR